MSELQKWQEVNNQRERLIEHLKSQGVESSIDDGIKTVTDKVVDNLAGKKKKNYKVQVIDFDDTIIDEVYLNSGEIYTLPQAPTHDRLTFQRYCASVEITDNKVVVADNDILIAPLYETTSGLSEFDVDVNDKTGLTITFNMDGTKNWGDGTTDTATSHTYASRGFYTITCDGTTMTTSSIGGLFGNYYTSSGSGGVKNFTLKNVRLASNVTNIASYAFANCYNLQTVTIPYGVTTLGSQCFEYTYSIRTIIFPSGANLNVSYMCRYANITKILIPYGCQKTGYSAFQGTKIEELILPESITLLETQTFYSCTQLKKIRLPKSITAMGMYALADCKPVQELIIPNNVSSFGNKCFDGNIIKKFKYPNSLTSIPQLFDYNNSLIELDFTEFTKVPSLPSTNNIPYRNDGIKIYVPDALYNDWIVATNWASLSGQIYKASEMQEV